MTTTRARNADREDARDMLDSAYASGQLTTEEHAARVASAARATTLARLHRLVSDLQTPDGSAQARFRPQPAAKPTPTSAPAKTARTGVIAALAVAAGLAVAVFLGLGPSGGEAGEDAPPTSLHTAAALGRLLDDLEREFGDLTVSEVLIYPEYASISRPIPDKPGQDQNYNYEISGGAGHLTEQGVSRRGDDPPMDLAPLRQSLPRVVGLLYGADATLRVPDPATVHLSIGYSGPAVEIYRSNDEQGLSGSLTIGLDGVVEHIRRGDQ